MVSTPRVIDFELLVIKFAKDLLKAFADQELFKFSSLEKDIKDYEKEEDYKMRFL